MGRSAGSNSGRRRIPSGCYECFQELSCWWCSPMSWRRCGCHRPRDLEHLGVDTNFPRRARSPPRGGLHAPAHRFARSVPLAGRHGLQLALAAAWRRLPRRAKGRLLDIYTVAEFRVGLWNRGRGRGAECLPVAAVTWEALDRHYAEDGKLLQRLVEREPPWQRVRRPVPPRPSRRLLDGLRMGDIA